MLQIPEGVDVKLEEGKIRISGKIGQVEKWLPQDIKIAIEGKNINIDGKSKALINTYKAHIKNAFIGVKDGFRKKLKIIFAHFPITVEIKGKDVAIKNFLGEKKPRKTTIVGKVLVEVKGQEMFVSGADKENVGATIANIKTATKIKEKDGRVFQDGFYIVE